MVSLNKEVKDQSVQKKSKKKISQQSSTTSISQSSQNKRFHFNFTNVIVQIFISVLLGLILLIASPFWLNHFLPWILAKFKLTAFPITPEDFVGVRHTIVTKSNEHVFTVGPMCFAPGFLLGKSMPLVFTTESLITCDTYPQDSSTVIVQKGIPCKSIEAQAIREAAFLEPILRKPVEWILALDAIGQVEWIPGTTNMVIFESKSNAVSNYLRVLLFIHHIFINKDKYSIDEIHRHLFFLPDRTLVDLLRPKSNSWHIGITSVILNNMEIRYGLKSLAELNHATFLRNPTDLVSSMKTVCFEKVIIPAHLKTRYFVTRDEISPANQVRISSIPAKESILIDKLIFQSFLENFTQLPLRKPGLKKNLSYLKREGSGRAFLPKDDQVFFDMLSKACQKKSFTVSAIYGQNFTFLEQVKAISESSIAIGIHGQNLINAMFLPDESILIEVFPFGFSHPQFENVFAFSASYVKYTMQHGDEFPGVFKYSSRAVCIKQNKACDLFYRSDSRPLKLDPSDLTGLEQVIDFALKKIEVKILRYLSSTGESSTSTN